jgi:mRNA-degrading endonuclease HigB of HigAB toxin-antitoxin module
MSSHVPGFSTRDPLKKKKHGVGRKAQAAPKSKVLNSDRARFEVAGGNYRLVVAFDFRRQVAFVKFIGTHAEYDRIDALTVSQY